MKICKHCGANVEDHVRHCPDCGATGFLHICANCGMQYEGNFCPNCGVRAGKKPKVCPECGTSYYSNACPNCGYTAGRHQSSPQTVVHRHVHVYEEDDNDPASRTRTSESTVERVLDKWHEYRVRSEHVEISRELDEERERREAAERRVVEVQAKNEHLQQRLQNQTGQQKKVGCGTILLWIFFFPVMIFVTIWKSEKMNTFEKLLLTVFVLMIFSWIKTN